MNRYLLVCVFATVMLVWSPMTVADDITRVAAALCDYAKQNNRSAMRKKLSQTRISLKRVFGGIGCGASDGFPGGDLLRTATYFGSFRTAKFIALKLGKNGLKTPAQDGKNILQWTEELQANGGGKAGDLSKFIEFYKSKM